MTRSIGSRALLVAASAIGAALPSVTAIAQAQIFVGPNVQVSRAHERSAHNEVILGADPEDANRLMACSIVYSSEAAKAQTVVYVSSDRGKTWTPTLDTSKLKFSGDPACAFGRGGAAYYVALGTTADDKNVAPVYRSSDGGKSWSEPVFLHGFHGLDREYIVVDNTSGKSAGHIYIHATGWARAMEGERKGADMSLFRSEDRGANFSGPVKRVSVGRNYVLGVGNGVVLSDGTFVSIFGEIKEYWDAEGADGDIQDLKPGGKPNGWVKVLRSTDAGESFEPAVVVSDFHMLWPPMATSMIASLAVDPGSPSFKDRLYAAWPDHRSGRQEILFSYSSDQGKTWSKPIVVNDDAPKSESHSDHLMPTVAVNRDGVVGVAWYDRRDNPDNRGWWVRFAASLDGGETFGKSVRVSEAPNAYGKNERWPVGASVLGGGTNKKEPAKTLKLNVSLDGFFYNGGHTGGIAADAGGVFHPLWVDNRTGLPQVWTAAVTVKGAVFKNGSKELADLDDISEKVTLDLSNVSYDRAKNEASVTARLKNTSKETLRGPVKARVVALSSDAGSAQIVNSDNGQVGAGAVWDFSALVPAGELKPDSVSESKRLLFRVSDFRPFLRGNDPHYGLVSLDARVLGKLEKPPEKKPE